MLALIGNMGAFELVVIIVIAVLIFGKDLPQAASKAYFQARKLRNAVDDLRRESGIDRELRNIERTVREAEWEARRTVARTPEAPPSVAALPPAPSPEPPATPSALSAEESGASEPPATSDETPPPSTDAASC